MRKRILLLVCLLAFCLAAAETNVLVVLPQNYGANWYCVQEWMDQMGWQYTTTAINASAYPCAGYAGPLGCEAITVDLLISEITSIEDYDAIMIIAASQFVGSVCDDLMGHQPLLDLLQMANSNDQVIWANCAAIRVLAAANILNGVTIQGPTGSNNQYYNEFIAAGAEVIGSKLPPVVDNNIITAMRGQYYMYENMHAISEAMHGLNR